jgi:hypothetical protein
MHVPSTTVQSQPRLAVDFRSQSDAFDLSIRFTDSKHKSRQICVERLPTLIHQEHCDQQQTLVRRDTASPSDGSLTVSSFNRRMFPKITQYDAMFSS